MKDEAYLAGIVGVVPLISTSNHKAVERKSHNIPIGNLILVIFPLEAVTLSAETLIKFFAIEPWSFDRV